jgi:hypothetical protein
MNMLLGSENNEGLNQLQKAQRLYHALMDCDTPQEFKKTFGEAIQKHALDEFYPVVVMAELSAALMICHFAASQVQGFAFRDHLRDFCGVKPAQLLNLKVQSISDITEMPVLELEPLLKAFGYTVNDGTIADHPEAKRRKEEIVSLAERRKSKNVG